MISSIEMTVGGQVQKLRLSTRAMASLERAHGGTPIQTIIAGLKDNAGVDFVAKFFSATMNDGRGASEDDAFDMIDAAGGAFELVDTVGEVIVAAFPESDPEADAQAGGKPKKAQSK